MPLIRFAADSDGTLVGYDAQSAFDEGNKYFDRGLWQESFLAFQKVVREFKVQKLTYPAAYNAGLSLARLKMYPEAISFFEVSLRSDDAQLTIRGRWNLIDLALRVERWGDAEMYAKALENLIYTPEDRIELRNLVKILKSWRNGDSYQEIASLVDHHRIDRRKGKTTSRVPESVGAYLSGLRVTQIMDPEKFNTLQFSDEATMTLREQVSNVLEYEAALLLEAQNFFLRAIRSSDAEWATASVYRIGEIYERFYRGLVAIALPAELDEESKKLYAEELDKIVKPVKNKAELAYSRLLKFAQRNVQDTPWVDRAKEKLEAIQKFDVFSVWGAEAPSE